MACGVRELHRSETEDASKKLRSEKQRRNPRIYEVSKLKIREEFIKNMLQQEYSGDYLQVYDNSPLLQYLEMNMDVEEEE